MDEYIPRKAVLDLQHRLYCSPFSTTIELSPTYIISPDAVQRIPAADVTPVIHSHWIFYLYELKGMWYECANCRCESDKKTQYCPDCGAKMDKEVTYG